MSGDNGKRRLCVVLAAYNEAGNVIPLLERLHLAAKAQQFTPRYVVVVQGDDGTKDQVESLRSKLGDLTVHYEKLPMGVGPAMRKGFSMISAEDEWVLTMDADLNHQPEELHRFVDAIEQKGADMVVGSRYIRDGRIEGMPTWKRLASTWMNRVITMLFGIDVADKTSGYRLIRAPIACEAAARTQSRGFDFYVEFIVHAHKLGAKIVEVPIVFKVRTVGVSKMRKLRTTINYFRLFARLSRNKS